MASRLLVLLALLAAATQAAGSCWSFEWQCRDGSECIWASERCDGEKHCGDGSDEEGCDALPTVALPVNATATARVQYDSVHHSIELHLCGAEHCSNVWLWGEQADGTLKYYTWTGCNRLGRSCSSHKDHGSLEHAFRTGEVVLVAQRRPGQLAVWRQGRPDDVATVAVQDDYSTLRVRPNRWAIDMPVQLTVSEPPAAQADPSPPSRAWLPSLAPAGPPAPSCVNGGIHDGHVCQCPPGFDGHSCQIACGPDRHGEGCAQRCSGTLTAAGRGCGGVRFCKAGDCTCAAGLRGPQCDQVCPGGSYGAGCSLQCGQCVGGCDPYSGECLQGCLPGFLGASCQKELLHLTAAPNISAVSSNSVSGSVQLEGNTAGSGRAAHLALQYRVAGAAWASGPLLPPRSGPFVLEGLPADTAVDVRAVLLDAALNGFQSVPQARVRTPPPRLLQGVAVTAAADGLRVSWNDSRPAYIEYHCTLSCPAGCGAPGRLQAAASPALLQGLQPHAVYRVTVAAEDEHVALEATTAASAPAVAVESLSLLAATNNSLVARWAPPADCERSPVSYRWELDASAGLAGNTSAPVLALRDLPPGRSWQLRVAAATPAGTGPWAALNVSTLHSPPSAPLQLEAFRWGKKFFRVRWVPPARPGGKLANYTVRVDGRLQATLPAAGSPCAAWPGFVCHSVPRAGAGAGGRAVAVAVSASNEWGGQEGDAATASVTLEDADPEPVEDLRATVVTPSSVLLRWRLPRLLHGDLASFRVLVDAGSAEDVAAVTLEGREWREERAEYEHTLSGLQPGTAYTVSVQCGGWTRLGTAAAVAFTTPRDAKDTLGVPAA